MVATRSLFIAPRDAGTAEADARSRPQILRRARFCRGRDAGSASQPRARTASPGFCHRASRPARTADNLALSAHLARIYDEKAARRRAPAHLAAFPCLPQRRTQRDPPPGILDARMVPC